MTTQFDQIIEEMNKKSRTVSRSERYPKNIALSSEFLGKLEDEYKSAYANGNRTVHSNFLKAVSFEIDVLRDRLKGDEKALSSELGDVMDSIDAMANAEAKLEGEVVEDEVVAEEE